VDHTTNWKPDPFGRHELRFFSADGKPTLLVMDGGKTSYDKLPRNPSEHPSATHPSNREPSITEPRFTPTPSPRSAPLAAPSPDYAPHSGPHEGGETQVSSPVVAPTSDATYSRLRVLDPTPPSAEPLKIVAVDRPQSGAGYREPEIMSRPLKIAYAIVCGLLAVSVLGLVYVHLLHHSGGQHSTLAARRTTTTLAHGTTTTVVLPTALSPSAEAAAAALVSSWSTKNRSAALTVATPAAVGTLFSAPYATGLAIARGCSTSFLPIVCVFGPPGGASPTDPLYKVKVSRTAGGWYVSSVDIEN
jgi:hypothetical protein